MRAHSTPPWTPSRSFRHSLPVLLAVLALMCTGCADQSTNPDASMTAHLAMAAVFPPEAAAQAAFVDAWRIQVSRPGVGVIAEQSGAVGPDQTTVSVQVSVTLESPCETLSIRVELSAGGEVWFRSERNHEVCSGGGNQLQTQELEFIRPLPTVNPGILPFVLEERGSSSGTFRISYAGADGLAWTASVQEANAGWLNLQSTTGTITSGQPQDVTVNANAVGLSPGSYSAHVVVTGEGFPSPIGLVLVTLQVTAGPRIGLSASSLSFTTVQGSSPGLQTFAITNVGGGTLAWNAGDNTGWLNLSPTSGSLAAGQSQTVTATVASGNLEPGSYLATITVTGTNATNSPLAVPVTLTVTAGPRIGLSTSSLSFTTVQGSSPGLQTFAITNVGGGTLAWNASDDGDWLTLSPTSGSLAAGQSQTVTARVASGTLGAGSYPAAITVTGANASNSPLTIPATLTVTAGPLIGLSPTSLSFFAVEGTNAFEKLISVSNKGGGVLNWQASANVGWLTLVPSSGSLGSPGGVGLSQWMTVSVNSSTMKPGSYSGTITVTAVGAANSPQTVSVLLTVTPRTAPTISNLTWSLRVLNDETCGNLGSRYDIYFDYVDPDGDVPVLDGTLFGNPVRLQWQFLPDGLGGEGFISTATDGDGFSGRASLNVCIAFQVEGNISVRETFSLRDEQYFWSNSLSITIPRPEGGNSPPLGSGQEPHGAPAILIGAGSGG